MYHNSYNLLHLACKNVICIWSRFGHCNFGKFRSILDRFWRFLLTFYKFLFYTNHALDTFSSFFLVFSMCDYEGKTHNVAIICGAVGGAALMVVILAALLITKPKKKVAPFVSGNIGTKTDHPLKDTKYDATDRCVAR